MLARLHKDLNDSARHWAHYRLRGRSSYLADGISFRDKLFWKDALKERITY